MLKQGANCLVPAVFWVGSTATTITLLVKGRYGWTSFDTFIAVLVLACLVVWFKSGPRRALIMSVIASTIAAVPFVVMTWKDPRSSLIVVNIVFLIGNALALIGAKAWTVEDRLYAVVNVATCSALVIPWLLCPF